MNYFLSNLPEFVSMVCFGIGFTNLLLNKNMIRKIIGLDIMDTSIYLFLAVKGYIAGTVAPIVTLEEQMVGVNTSLYTNPIPAGLVLTGIVVSVSVSAILLAITVRLYEEFHTLDIDEIIHMVREEDRRAE
ncbi:MAG: cation:proton antiporter subunit C [Bacillota bacterium]|nr:cation:proton antiporter subunit C [Bacillota bacterium]